MSSFEEVQRRRPMRADARRNYDAVLDAARVAFTELGTGVALEEIARRAGVGIATLYRNFPTREDLIETLYINEVSAIGDAAVEFADLAPWEALEAWIHRFVSFVGTKNALIVGLNRDSETFKACRASLYRAGEPLLTRAQESAHARSDVSIDDVMRLVMGIAGVNFVSEAQRDHVMAIAIDGLRGPKAPEID